MPETDNPIDLTISIAKTCGTCEHYRNSRDAYLGKEYVELTERFKDVPQSEGVFGGYCLQAEKIRLTSRLSVCGGWSLTKNKSRIGTIRKRMCQHEWVLSCTKKSVVQKSTDGDNPYHNVVRHAFLTINLAWLCKFCYTFGPYTYNETRANRYIIYLSKTVAEAMAISTIRASGGRRVFPDAFEMIPEDKNPDYYDLADNWFTKLKINRPVPEGFIIKDSWST